MSFDEFHKEFDSVVVARHHDNYKVVFSLKVIKIKYF